MNEAILLVDDDEDTIMLLGEGLRRRGFNVEWVTSARACLEHLDSSQCDLVVTDVQMPGMSGIELCGALRDRTPSPLAIVVTGLKDLKTANAAVNNGAFVCMTKPVKLADLANTIQCALTSRQRARG